MMVKSSRCVPVLCYYSEEFRCAPVHCYDTEEFQVCPSSLLWYWRVPGVAQFTVIIVNSFRCLPVHCYYGEQFQMRPSSLLLLFIMNSFRYVPVHCYYCEEFQVFPCSLFWYRRVSEVFYFNGSDGENFQIYLVHCLVHTEVFLICVAGPCCSSEDPTESNL